MKSSGLSLHCWWTFCHIPDFHFVEVAIKPLQPNGSTQVDKSNTMVENEGELHYRGGLPFLVAGTLVSRST